jgi:hypothetical protein
VSESKPLEALRQSISLERLSKYLAASHGNSERAISLYEHNMRLSEAFYTPLQCLEVCLRNKMHDQLTDRFAPNWYDLPATGLLSAAGVSVAGAIRELRQSKKQVTPGAVVAELSFGTWVSLLGPVYDATLWRTTLTKAFRLNGKGMKRSVVHGRMNALRRFRNRVAHHEPIFQKDLPAVHAELLEAIEWLCPATAHWAGGLSRARAVIASGAGA